MKRIRGHLMGVEQGDTTLFSDFETDGEMWTGRGQRERRCHIKFSQAFRSVPIVQITVSLWDMSADTVIRADISAEDVAETGFEAVFRTWGDTRVARMRVGWTAIGELPDEDDWDLY